MEIFLHWSYLVIYWIVIWCVVNELLASVIKGIKGQSAKPFKGGNGCNVGNAPDREPCCNTHDKAYKEGGWYIARLQADWQLFKCALKEGAKIWPFIYLLGVRLGGMWAFQWGKKRKLVLNEDGTYTIVS